MTSSLSLIDKKEQRFQNLALATIVVIYLLILAGGIVRSTGSGMGCPDWPKCFGRWIPPTELGQLPANYQQIYGAKLKGEIEFNAVKTWIEYINRLLGVLSGFFVFATLLTSFSYWGKDKAIVYGSLTAFLLVGANGWLGSKVVATELAHYMVTFHLLLAILVVFALLFVLVRCNIKRTNISFTSKNTNAQRWMLLGLLVITLGQIVLGTQVRDALNEVVKRLGYDQRDNWIGALDWRFYIHRSFSIAVLIAHIILIYQIRKVSKSGLLGKLTKGLVAFVIVEIVTGIIMAYLGVPAFAQPVHLIVAVIIIGLQFSIGLILSPTLLFSDNLVDKSQFVEV